MNVNNVSQTSSSPPPATRGSQELGKDQFMRLMLTQLQNQDPTAPADNQQMIAQMAQFSTLELMQRTDRTMSALLMAQAASNQQQAIGLVGKDVVIGADTIDLKAGDESPRIQMQLPEKTSALDITIVDESGKEVRRIKAGSQEAGPFGLTWDGKDDSGNPLPDGKYTVKVNAIGVDGDVLDVSPEEVLRVDGVLFEDGIARIRAGDRIFGMNEVVEVR
jgi:flagellar basal-body rod modification protein FlgD